MEQQKLSTGLDKKASHGVGRDGSRKIIPKPSPCLGLTDTATQPGTSQSLLHAGVALDRVRQMSYEQRTVDKFAAQVYSCCLPPERIGDTEALGHGRATSQKEPGPRSSMGRKGA
jgi:hypothetical protein